LQLADVLSSAKASREALETMKAKVQAAEQQREAALVNERQLRPELAATLIKLESAEAERDSYRTQV
jgi:hypothetical protein